MRKTRTQKPLTDDQIQVLHGYGLSDESIENMRSKYGWSFKTICNRMGIVRTHEAMLKRTTGAKLRVDFQ